MRYSLEPHYRRYVQAQGFMPFARNISEINMVEKYLIQV